MHYVQKKITHFTTDSGYISEFERKL